MTVHLATYALHHCYCNWFPFKTKFPISTCVVVDHESGLDCFFASQCGLIPGVDVPQIPKINDNVHSIFINCCRCFQCSRCFLLFLVFLMLIFWVFPHFSVFPSVRPVSPVFLHDVLGVLGVSLYLVFLTLLMFHCFHCTCSTDNYCLTIFSR
jgi:hypothetical protein